MNIHTHVWIPYTHEKQGKGIRWLKQRVYFWPQFYFSGLHVCFGARTMMVLCFFNYSFVIQFESRLWCLQHCWLCSGLLWLFGGSFVLPHEALNRLFCSYENVIRFVMGITLNLWITFDNQAIYIIFYGCTYMGVFLSFGVFLHFFSVLGPFCGGGYWVLNPGSCTC